MKIIVQIKMKIMMMNRILNDYLNKIQVQYEDELNHYVQNKMVLLMNIIELMMMMISYHQLIKIVQEFYYNLMIMENRDEILLKWIISVDYHRYLIEKKSFQVHQGFH